MTRMMINQTPYRALSIYPAMTTRPKHLLNRTEARRLVRSISHDRGMALKNVSPKFLEEIEAITRNLIRNQLLTFSQEAKTAR